MPLALGLTDKEASAVVNQVLRQHWHDFGYVRAEVHAGPDHDGDAAIFVDVTFRADSPELPVDAYSPAVAAMDEELRARGETRFAYLHLTRPDEPVIDAADEGEP